MKKRNKKFQKKSANSLNKLSLFQKSENKFNRSCPLSIKNAPIIDGQALQVIDGGAKYVVKSGDVLKVVSDTASSCDVIVSVVDAISE